MVGENDFSRFHVQKFDKRLFRIFGVHQIFVGKINTP